MILDPFTRQQTGERLENEQIIGAFYRSKLARYVRMLKFPERGRNMSVGKQIRRIRKAQGLTIKDTSIMANITSSLISQIENDKANPSLATLNAISNALNVSIIELLNENVNDEMGPVVRSNNQIRIYDSHSWTQLALTQLDLTKFSVFLVHMREGANSDDYPELNPHGLAAYEFGFVLSGKLQVILEGKVYVINSGDSISFMASKKHSLSNLLTSETTVLWVIILI